MIADPIFFRDLAYVLVGAVLGGALAGFARRPLILGEVGGGIVISPLTPGPSVSDILPRGPGSQERSLTFAGCPSLAATARESS